MRIREKGLYGLTLISFLFGLTACGGGGGGGGGNAPPVTYTIGGTVAGLAGSGLVLQNNGGDDLNIAVDGSGTASASVM